MGDRLTRVPAERLAHLMRRALDRRGLSEAHIDAVVSGLISTSLRGVDTHGICLFPTYLAELDGGRSRARPDLRWQRPAGGVGLLDAGQALGLVAGSEASREAVRLALSQGIGAVGVRNSNHFGAASVFTLAMARQADVIAMSFTNSDALVAPFAGRRRIFGTNPQSFAVRGSGDEVFCVDMAASQVAFSKIRRHQTRGTPLESGWAVLADGRDASLAENDETVAALEPVGGYKGQCLAMMVEILCAVLMGQPLDHQLSHLFEPPYDEPRHVGHFFLALSLAAFGDPEAFRSRLDELMAIVREQEGAVEGRAVVPGDLELATAARRQRQGIPLTDAELSAFQEICAEVGEPLLS